MAVTRHSIYPASFVYAGPTTLNLQQVSRVGFKAGTNKEVVYPGGAVDPAAIPLAFAEARQMIETLDLAGVLAAVSISAGLSCTGGNTARYQARSSGGTFASSTAHFTLTGSRGFLLIDDLGGEQDKPISLGLEYVPLWDETYSGAIPVPPVVPTASVDFASAPAPAFNSIFFTGPVYLGAGQVEGVVGWKVKPGITFATKRADGEIYAPRGSIVARAPTLEFRILNTHYAATINHLFNKDPGAAVKLYGIKGVHGGARVALSSGVHLVITCSTGAWNPEEINVSGQDDATTTIQVQATGTISAATNATLA